MASPTLIYLPGLHGTGDLAGPFLKALPATVHCRVLEYPIDEPHDYVALLSLITEQLRDESKIILIGESFAGPLAILFAAAHPERVDALVLVATFARRPLPSWLGYFAPVICRLPLPALLIRSLLIGARASGECVDQIRRAIRKNRPAVLSLRLKSVFTVDCTDSLNEVRSPILFIAPTRDHLVPAASLRLIRTLRSGAEVRAVEGPHLILQHSPAAAWEAIRQFCRL